MEQNNQNIALLVMDVQGATIKMLADSASFIQSITKAVQSARSKNIPVIYIVVGFRKGYPEVSPNNKSFSALKNGAMDLDTEASFKVHESVEPKVDEIIVTKKRVECIYRKRFRSIIKVVWNKTYRTYRYCNKWSGIIYFARSSR